MIDIITKLLVLFGYTCAILLALCIIFACIASYILNKNDIDYTEALRELEESESETNNYDR